MKDIADFLWESRGAILVACALLLIICLTIQWIAWTFKIGRFSRPPVETSRERDLRYVVVEFFVKLIDDFRHFLAIVLVLIFAAILVTATIKYGSDVKNFVSAIQAVMATLGTLIGSIIGYYFGESAVRSAKRNNAVSNDIPEQSVLFLDKLNQEKIASITEAPEPPNLDNPKN